jgi:hypothetical protein
LRRYAARFPTISSEAGMSTHNETIGLNPDNEGGFCSFERPLGRPTPKSRYYPVITRFNRLLDGSATPDRCD